MNISESPLDLTAPGVFMPREDIIRIGLGSIERIKIEARHAPRKRARINAHPGPDAPVQEMLIALDQHTYLRPHKHIEKSESFHVIEGIADVVIFDDEGDIIDVVPLGPPPGPRCFYYRQSRPRFHTLIIHTPDFVIHETTNGPFRPEYTVFAPWAPDESDPGATEYMEQLRERVAGWVQNSSRA